MLVTITITVDVLDETKLIQEAQHQQEASQGIATITTAHQSASYLIGNLLDSGAEVHKHIRNPMMDLANITVIS